jgi:hypothetical protein
MKRLAAIDKKKIKLLKGALKEERAIREKIESDLEKATIKIATLTKSLQESEEKYLIIYQENINFQESLMAGH